MKVWKQNEKINRKIIRKRVQNCSQSRMSSPWADKNKSVKRKIIRCKTEREKKSRALLSVNCVCVCARVSSLLRSINYYTHYCALPGFREPLRGKPVTCACTYTHVRACYCEFQCATILSANHRDTTAAAWPSRPPSWMWIMMCKNTWKLFPSHWISSCVISL